MGIKRTLNKALHRKRDHMHLANHIFVWLLLLLLTTALMGAVWNEFPETKPFQNRFSSASPETPVATFRGMVVSNVRAEAPSGDFAYALVQDEKGKLYSVYYTRGTAPCRNSAAFESGFDLEPGQKVSVRGKAINKDIWVCDSPGYYIKVVESNTDMAGASGERVSALYYGNLLAQCADQPSAEAAQCCEMSVAMMSEGGYMRASGLSCPSGYSVNQLDCPSSFMWCEPAMEAEISASDGAFADILQ